MKSPSEKLNQEAYHRVGSLISDGYRIMYQSHLFGVTRIRFKHLRNGNTILLIVNHNTLEIETRKNEHTVDTHYFGELTTTC